MNKVVVVTGASTGIGRSISIGFGKEGATIFITSRSEDKLNETKKIVEKESGKAIVIPADLSNPKEVQIFIGKVKSETDKVDILVNVAGVWHGKDEVYADKDFEKFDTKVILDTLGVGTIAPILLAHSFVPLMPKNAKILNISGTFESGARGWLPYYVSKKAIEDFTIGLAEELKDKNIQVNCISPSDTATEEYGKYFPQYMDEAIDPNEIAQYAAYLCSKEANEITGTVWVMKKGKKPYKGYHS